MGFSDPFCTLYVCDVAVVKPRQNFREFRLKVRGM